jgi:hypothetical protein
MTLSQVAGVLIAVAFVAVFASAFILERRRRAARDAALARDAVQRGWRYSTSAGGRGRTQQWTGIGPGGVFTAEASHRSRRRRSDLHVVRWWNGAPDQAPPAAALTLLIQVGDEVPPTVLAGDGVLASLAQSAFRMGLGLAFATHFRTALSIEGRDLQRVEPERSVVPGFAVLSDQPLEAARRLTPAFVAAVVRAFPPESRDDGPAGPFQGDRARAWIGLCGDRIAVASRTRKAADLADIVALVAAGAAIAAARG